jgi:hypothetical protein
LYQPNGSELRELKASSSIFSRSSEKASVEGEGVQWGRDPWNFSMSSLKVDSKVIVVALLFIMSHPNFINHPMEIQETLEVQSLGPVDGL